MDVTWKVLGKRLGTQYLNARGADTVYFVYWWAIPIAQFFLAMCVISEIFLLLPANGLSQVRHRHLAVLSPSVDAR